MEKIEIIEFNGYTATVIIPERPNGKWIWKTEFLYAFDQAERALLEQGYTRVYFNVIKRKYMLKKRFFKGKNRYKTRGDRAGHPSNFDTQ